MFDLAQIPLFALADRKLAWIDRRQQVLSQDIANADTPGWRAHDVKPFAALLQSPPLTLAATEGEWLPPADAGSAVAPAETLPTEVSADGNGVVLDAALLRVADTDMTHTLTTELLRSYMGMFRTAIGR